MKRLRAAGVLIVVSVSAACSGTPAGSPGGQDAGAGGQGMGAGDVSVPGAVTYHQHVAPIFQAKCATCHTAGGIAPFSLDSAADAQAHAALIKVVTQSGDMPPWPPGPMSPRMRHERTLTAAELALLSAWVDGGALPGDPANPAAPGKPELVDIGAVDLAIDTGVDYVPDSALTDDYRCFMVDPHVTENRMVIGYRITPGNRKIVHHVITTLFASGDRAALEALDAESPERAGWPCVGGPAPTDSAVTPDGSLGSWVPGVASVVLPAGTGTAIRAGDVAVVQVHYNLRGGAEPDRTKIEVQFAPRATPLQQLATVRLLKRNLVLPANQAGIVQENSFPVRVWTAGRFYPDGDAHIVAVAGHMHTLGTRITIERKNAQGTTTLLDIPHWHFHWQGSYQLVEPIALGAEDELTVRCTFDNTAERRAHEGVNSPVTEVRWGEGTEDEMCIGYVTVVDRKP